MSDSADAIAGALRRVLDPILRRLEERLEARVRAVEDRLVATFLDRAPVPGPTGPPGPPGTLGAVAAWSADSPSTAGRVVTHRGSLWQAQSSTQAEPGSSAAWLAIVDGVAGAELVDGDLVLAMGSGLVYQAGPVRGEPGPGFTWRARFDPQAEYAACDVVIHDGSAWICTDPQHTAECPSAGWELFAQRGRRGPRGPVGGAT